MSITRLQQKSSHPARDAALKSIRAVQDKDRDGWLAMWHPEGLIQDPVGVSPLDPAGEGHRGIEAITAFYDNVIAQGDIRFHIRESFAWATSAPMWARSPRALQTDLWHVVSW